MATTSIWSVKGSLGKVVIYVENPDKTKESVRIDNPDITDKERQGLADVISYAVREEKTRRQDDDQNELHDENLDTLHQYVSGVNCYPSTAREEMIAVKVRYGKNEGVMAYHGYQSFAPGECTPAMAHEIGLKLAEELWGSRFQVIVATHLDKSHHLHNHFVVNSVSFSDGLRYNRSEKDYYNMRTVSDRLCKEYGLSVIEHQRKKGKQYSEWKADENKQPTYRAMILADLDAAVAVARTEKQFYALLKQKGYELKFGQDITVRPMGRERGVKLARNFGSDYTREAICSRILHTKVNKNAVSLAQPTQPTIHYQKKVVNFHCQMIMRRKTSRLRGLYLHYCYLLGILPKNKSLTHQAQLPISLKEDLRKLDKISKETRLLCHYRIDTSEQLNFCKNNLLQKMNSLADERKHLRYQSRSMKDDAILADIKNEISDLTKQIGKIRSEIKLCDGISIRSKLIEEKLKIIQQNRPHVKEGTGHEHIRRSR